MNYPITELVNSSISIYSGDNIKHLNDFGVITVFQPKVAMHDEIIMENRDMKNSRNYFQYGDETVFLREKRMHGFRYILFFPPYLRTNKLESFYYALSKNEKSLDVFKGKSFRSSKDMVKSVEEELNGLDNFVELQYDSKCMKFSYKLKHKPIQRKTSLFCYTTLITNRSTAANELLKMYREKDAVEKSFSHIKPHLEAFSRTEEGTRARMFLTVLAYTLLAIISFKLGISYNQALNAISGIREVVYSSGAHAPVEYTKEQKEILKKLKLKL